MAIITISRGTCSGGRALAESVADRLGYRCIALEVLTEASKKYGMALEKLEHALKDKPGTFERMGKERMQALAFIGAALCDEIGDEKVVYHGNGGQFLLKDVSHVLRVRIVADMDYRVRAAMAQRKMDREAAVKFIRHADNVRMRWAAGLYHANLLDPSLYDIIVNLERTSVSGACDLVCHLASRPEFQPTLRSRKALADFCLASRIRARMAADKAIDGCGIEVEINDGVVALTHGIASHHMGRIQQLIEEETGAHCVNVT